MINDRKGLETITVCKKKKKKKKKKNSIKQLNKDCHTGKTNIIYIYIYIYMPNELSV